MRKTYVTLKVSLVILSEEDVDISTVIDEADYNFNSTTENADILDTTIEDFEITDSK